MIRALYPRTALITVSTSLLILAIAYLQGGEPSWWQIRGIADPAQQKDDYAAANIGQLKHVASQAYAELSERLPGGVGETLEDLVDSFDDEGPGRNDFAAINVGQLKAVAKPFYDRLIATGLRSTYPWSDSDPERNDYALVNIGQLKNIFSFGLELTSEADTDEDGLADAWEMEHFGDLTQTGSGDVESGGGDGLTNLEEFWSGTDPTEATSLSGSDGSIALQIHTDI